MNITMNVMDIVIKMMSGKNRMPIILFSLKAIRSLRN